MKENKYFKMPREIFKEKYAHLTTNAKVMYAYLCYLESEHGKNFKCPMHQMAKDLPVGLSTIRSSKQQLVDAGLISYTVTHTEKGETYSTYSIKCL